MVMTNVAWNKAENISECDHHGKDGHHKGYPGNQLLNPSECNKICIYHVVDQGHHHAEYHWKGKLHICFGNRRFLNNVFSIILLSKQKHP